MDEHKHPTHYEIHLRGQLGDRLLGAFPELRARTRNHETLLTGPLPDQSALHGVLTRIEALGLELLEVRRLRTQPRAACETGEHGAPATAKRSGETPAQPGCSSDEAGAGEC